MKIKVKKSRLNVQNVMGHNVLVMAAVVYPLWRRCEGEAQATALADHPLKRRPQKI
jgi:hypothetical protein